MRSAKRSSCASGSGYVPSYSIGFCVAMTMNGASSGRVTPSTVTCRSSMHSSSAACVFGEARLTSSTRRRLAKTGPARNSNSLRCWLKTLTPVTSDGSRSGVNWSRAKRQSSERASAFASIVFPTPGKSSTMRCPSATRQRTTRRSDSSGACTTRPRFAVIDWRTSAGAGSRARSAIREKCLHFVEDQSGDFALRSLRKDAVAGGGDERDGVLGRVEADAGPRDVVEHEQVGALAFEFRARAIEAVLLRLRREPDDDLAIAPLR